LSAHNSTPPIDHDARWQFQGCPALVAHRGYAKNFPENSLRGISAARDAGAAFIECDIQLSRDGIPFLMHDTDFKRVANTNGRVFDMTMSEISAISVGEPRRFGSEFAPTPPATLQMLVQQLNAWGDVHCFIEAKEQSINKFGLDFTMTRILAETARIATPFTVISFSREAVEYVQSKGGISTGWVIRNWNRASLNSLKRLEPEFVYCNYKIIPDRKYLPEGPWSWVLYEVTRQSVAAKWRRRGAHMIETMDVSAMLQSREFTGAKADE